MDAKFGLMEVCKTENKIKNLLLGIEPGPMADDHSTKDTAVMQQIEIRLQM